MKDIFIASILKLGTAVCSDPTEYGSLWAELY